MGSMLPGPWISGAACHAAPLIQDDPRPGSKRQVHHDAARRDVEQLPLISGGLRMSASRKPKAETFYATLWMTARSLSTTSPICASDMVSGGVSASVSPVMRSTMSCAWKALSIAS